MAATPEVPMPPPEVTDEERAHWRRVLGLRREVAVLHRLLADRERRDREGLDVDYLWASSFDRKLLSLFGYAPSDSTEGPALRPLPCSPTDAADGATSSSREAPPAKRPRGGDAPLPLPPAVAERCTLLSVVPPAACPINADIQCLALTDLGRIQRFDAVVVDPPWNLQKTTEVSQVSRGVELGYGVLNDAALRQLRIGDVVDDGLLFLWGINSKWNLCFHLLEVWGFSYLTTMQWVKQDRRTGRLAKGHGYYLMHAKEFILVGRRGRPAARGGLDSNVLFAPRSIVSAKPEELYELVERLFPNGRFLDIFGRLTSLRCGWVSIGNELDAVGQISRTARSRALAERWATTGHFDDPEGGDPMPPAPVTPGEMLLPPFSVTPPPAQGGPGDSPIDQ